MKSLINKFEKKKYNYIYGIGVLGKLLYCELRDLGIEIDGIIVSDGYKKNEKYRELPIYEVKEIENRAKESKIYFSVMTNKNDIIVDLKERGFEEVLELNDYHILEKFKYSEVKHSIFKDIDTSKEYIIIEDMFKIINPFKMNAEYQFSFWSEYPDLIRPICNNDYSEINEGPYEYSNVKLEVGDVVIDAGANIGMFSAYAAYKQCKVYAFEPVNTTIEMLKLNANLYKELIKPCEYGLSNKKEQIKCYINENNMSNSILENKDIFEKNSDDYINVQLITIDEFVKENKLNKVDFIKADIEGAERYMIEGAKETLAKFGPKLAICTYHLKDDPEVLENLIKKYNNQYVIQHKWKKLYAYIPDDNK